MSETPVPRDPGQGDDPPGVPGVPAGPGEHPSLSSPGWTPVPQRPDWDEAWLAARAGDEDPGDPEEYEDPDNAPPPGLDDDQLAALIAEAREVTAGQAYAAELAARLGHTAALAAAGVISACRRGPGMPGSAPKRHKPGAPDGPDPPGRPSFTFTPAGQPGPPGGYGTWRLSTGTAGQQDLLIQIGPIPTGSCDHRHEAKGHDPGVMLRHLAQVRNATCTGPGCRRPATRADFEHNIPYEAGGRSCLCNGDPKCRHCHRMKQHPQWKTEKLADGGVRWTMPSGRSTSPNRPATRFRAKRKSIRWASRGADPGSGCHGGSAA